MKLKKKSIAETTTKRTRKRDEDLSNKKKKKLLSEKKKTPAEGCRRNVEEGEERKMNFPAEEWNLHWFYRKHSTTKQDLCVVLCCVVSLEQGGSRSLCC